MICPELDFRNEIIRFADTERSYFAEIVGYGNYPRHFLAECAVAVALRQRKIRATRMPRLPQWCRRKINGMGSSGDRGVDIIGIDNENHIVVVQVKWTSSQTHNGYEVTAKLLACKLLLEADPEISDVRTMIVLRTDSILTKGHPGQALIEIVRYPEALVEEMAEFARIEMPQIERVLNEDKDLAVLNHRRDEFQTEVARLLTDKFEEMDEIRQPDTLIEINAELPTGVGKSRIELRLCEYFHQRARDLPIIVTTPRVDLVHQLAGVFREKNNLNVFEICDGTEWPDRPIDIITMTGQSVAKQIPLDLNASVVIRDEAHLRHGADIADRVKAQAYFGFSATFDEKTALTYKMTRDDAVRRGFICDIEYTFAVFLGAIGPKDMAAHLASHTEYAHVLVCFKSRRSAIEFAKISNDIGAGPAASYTTFRGDLISYPTDRPFEPRLDQFKTGKLRMLCVVGKVEIGIDIPICDAVVFAEPWGSIPRMRQLCGRASRISEQAKPAGKFTALFFVSTASPDDESENYNISRVLHLLREHAHEYTTDNIDVVIATSADEWQAATSDESQTVLNDELIEKQRENAIAAIREIVFDSSGNMLNSEYSKLWKRYNSVKLKLATVDATNYEKYEALVQKTDDEFPKDPAMEFFGIFGLKFPWDDYLNSGRSKILTQKELRIEIKKAKLYAIKTGKLHKRALNEKSAVLYNILYNIMDSPKNWPKDLSDANYSIDDIF